MVPMLTSSPADRAVYCSIVLLSGYREPVSVDSELRYDCTSRFPAAGPVRQEPARWLARTLVTTLTARRPVDLIEREMASTPVALCPSGTLRRTVSTPMDEMDAWAQEILAGGSVGNAAAGSCVGASRDDPKPRS